MGSPYEPTGAAFLPEEGAAYLRLEGFEDQLAYRSAALSTHLGRVALSPLADDAGRTVWIRLRDGAALGASPSDAVWKISVAPTKAAGALAAIAAERPIRHCLDWSGGLIWLATPETDGAGAMRIHTVAAEAGGHATLIRASEALRATVPVFQPPAPAVMKLQVGLKASFDPDGILNPGRMHAGL